MNIDELEAGPELDALVAEKVMGWKWNIRNGVCYAEHDTFNAPDCWPAFSPSTDIAAAWEVMEKLVSMDFDVDVAMSSKVANDYSKRCYCHFQAGDDNAPWKENFKLAQAWALTAPLAICRAALKAVGK